MPGVVIGWLVNLAQLVLTWIDLVGGLAGRIASDVAEQDSGITH
jgi:hypothetical protein